MELKKKKNEKRGKKADVVEEKLSRGNRSRNTPVAKPRQLSDSAVANNETTTAKSF